MALGTDGLITLYWQCQAIYYFDGSADIWSNKGYKVTCTEFTDIDDKMIQRQKRKEHR